MKTTINNRLMKSKWYWLVLVPLAVFLWSPAQAQTTPDNDQVAILPFQGPDGAGPERLGVNSFGAGRLLGGIHSDAIPLPDDADILIPPVGPRRIYLVARFYGCRPWFIHPYLGTTLTPQDLIAGIGSDNPEVTQVLAGQSLDDLMRPRAELGDEPVLLIEDEGLVAEDNPVAVNCFQQELNAELANAAALNVQLNPGGFSVVRAPYYGLYCLKIRICIPYVSGTPRQAWRYWLQPRFRIHQPACWGTFWCYRHFDIQGQLVIRPWYPLSVPWSAWLRVGPDWVCNITNWNSYRHWCLYGFRYYCTFFGTPPFQLNSLPGIAQLRFDQNPDLNRSTPWLRPWPYPRVRYWPYRPYCTRWFWFRPIPWFQYRYFPPVVNFAIAKPNAENGGGFLPMPDDNPNDPRFPVLPPTRGIDGLLANQDAPAQGAPFDSFFDIDVECRGRASIVQEGDNDGNGVVTRGDFPRQHLIQRALDPSQDSLDLPAVQ